MRSCNKMPFHAGIVLKIYPSYVQKQIIAANDGNQRFVYNFLVAHDRERYRLSKYADFVPAYRERIEFLDTILRNPDKDLALCIKNIAPFLSNDEADSCAVQNAIRNYKKAWQNYREIPGFGVPTFHKKGYEQSYNTNAHYKSGAKNINDGNVHFENHKHITLPIIGRIRISGSYKQISEIMNREDTRIGTIRVYKNADDSYYVSLQLASEKPFFFCDKLKEGTPAGFDLNISNFLCDSDGNEVDNPKFHNKAQGKLSKAQKNASRKAERAKKDGRPLEISKNYQKARRKVSHIQRETCDRTEDFHHKVSKGIIKNHDIIVFEDLQVKNLLKNHSLAYAIAEVGWSGFLAKVEYKSVAYGRTFIKVPPHYTTQTCSKCGCVLKGEQKLGLGDREWICPNCGTYHVRDYNAAKNILAKGLDALSDAAPGCSSGQADLSPGMAPRPVKL